MLNKLNTNISNDARLYRLPKGFDSSTITTATQALPVGTEDFGAFALEGETLSHSVTTETVKSRNKQQVMRVFVSDETKSLAINAIEDKPLVRTTYHGAEETNGVMDLNGFKVEEYTYVYDSIDDGPGYEKNLRFIFEATAAPNGDLTYVPGSLVIFPILLTVTGKFKRITEQNGVVVTEPTDPPVDPNPTTYPAVTNILTSYEAGTQTLSVQWDVPNLGMDDFVSGYTVNLAPVDAGMGAGAYPSGPSAELSPVAPGDYQLTVSYGVNGLPQQHGSATVPVTVVGA
jgi:hypothetical protein